MSFKDCVKFIFWNKGRNNDIELTEFFKLFKGKKYETISHQAIGKQRIFIKPELFINIYKKFIDLILGCINGKMEFFIAFFFRKYLKCNGGDVMKVVGLYLIGLMVLNIF